MPTNPAPIRTLHDERTEAARLGLSVRTLQMWRTKGQGPRYFKLGTGPQAAVRYDPVITDRWLDAQARENTGPSAA